MSNASAGGTAFNAAATAESDGRAVDKARAAVAYYERELAALDDGIANAEAQRQRLTDAADLAVADLHDQRDRLVGDLEAARAAVREA